MARASGHTGTATINSVLVKGVESWNIDYTANIIEVTGMDSGGIAEHIGGVTRWSGSITGHYDGATGGSLGTVTPGASLTHSLVTNTTAGKTYAGTAIIESCNPEVSVDGSVRFTINFTGTGALTIT